MTSRQVGYALGSPSSISANQSGRSQYTLAEKLRIANRAVETGFMNYTARIEGVSSRNIRRTGRRRCGTNRSRLQGLESQHSRQVG